MRTVAALYDTRAEAETAHARLSSEVKAEQIRIITRETVGALGTLKISPQDAETYREGLGRGSFLLVGNVASGEDAERIVRILQQSRAASPASERAAAGLDEAAVPRVEEELRVDKRQVVRGGVRVHSTTREQPAEQALFLKQEHLEAETRPAERRLSLEEVERGGLLKERVIEVSEMREEPVVTKTPYVREEIVLTKTVTERVETISDTVRRTDVEVEERSAAPRPGSTGR